MAESGSEPTDAVEWSRLRNKENRDLFVESLSEEQMDLLYNIIMAIHESRTGSE